MGDGAALRGLHLRASLARVPGPSVLFFVIWNPGRVAPGCAARARCAVTRRKRCVAMRRALHGPAGAQGGDMALPEDMRVNGGIRYVSNDDDTGDKLYNREIQDVLAQLVKKKKVDVIGFDACLMAMIETGYALRNTGVVLVGSEELKPGAGWNYERWLRPLADDPAAHAAADLGKLLVSAYRDEYGDRDDTTLSAVNLARSRRSQRR